MTNRANIACNTIGINQLIDDGYNTNELIDLSDTLHNNFSLIVVDKKSLLNGARIQASHVSHINALM